MKLLGLTEAVALAFFRFLKDDSGNEEFNQSHFDRSLFYGKLGNYKFYIELQNRTDRYNMKIRSLLCACLLVLPIALSSAAEEKASPQPGKNVVTVKAPFDNHWDSASWEPGSQDFWNKKEAGIPAKPVQHKPAVPASGK